MDKFNFNELLKTRQACRDFNDTALQEEKVYEIAKMARLAPSACNSQPWKMYCVTSKEKVELVKEALTEGGRNAFIKKAKAFIVVGEKATTLKADVLKQFSLDYWVKYDVGELIAYITLSAKSLGVESIIIGWLNKEKLFSAVPFSEGEDCTLVVALGYSDSPIREKVRRDEKEVIEII